MVIHLLTNCNLNKIFDSQILFQADAYLTPGAAI